MIDKQKLIAMFEDLLDEAAGSIEEDSIIRTVSEYIRASADDPVDIDQALNSSKLVDVLLQSNMMRFQVEGWVEAVQEVSSSIVGDYDTSDPNDY